MVAKLKLFAIRTTIHSAVRVY